MTFADARDLAIEFGAKLPRFDHTSPVAQCWIDRIENLPLIDCPFKRAAMIAEANRYAG